MLEFVIILLIGPPLFGVMTFYAVYGMLSWQKKYLGNSFIRLVARRSAILVAFVEAILIIVFYALNLKS